MECISGEATDLANLSLSTCALAFSVDIRRGPFLANVSRWHQPQFFEAVGPGVSDKINFGLSLESTPGAQLLMINLSETPLAVDGHLVCKNVTVPIRHGACIFLGES